MCFDGHDAPLTADPVDVDQDRTPTRIHDAFFAIDSIRAHEHAPVVGILRRRLRIVESHRRTGNRLLLAEHVGPELGDVGFRERGMRGLFNTGPVTGKDRLTEGACGMLGAGIISIARASERAH